MEINKHYKNIFLLTYILVLKEAIESIVTQCFLEYIGGFYRYQYRISHFQLHKKSDLLNDSVDFVSYSIVAVDVCREIKIYSKSYFNVKIDAKQVNVEIIVLCIHDTFTQQFLCLVNGL